MNIIKQFIKEVQPLVIEYLDTTIALRKEQITRRRLENEFLERHNSIEEASKKAEKTKKAKKAKKDSPKSEKKFICAQTMARHCKTTCKVLTSIIKTYGLQTEFRGKCRYVLASDEPFFKRISKELAKASKNNDK